MPSEESLHWQDLVRTGLVPDLYHVFGKFQVFLTPRVGSTVAQQALRELANVIGLPTWVVTPEMLSQMWETDFRFMSRKQKEDERETVSIMISIFRVDVMYWADCIAPDRREEIETALRRFNSNIHTNGRTFFGKLKSRRRFRSR